MTMSDEIWKDIVGYEGYYQVSNKGRVKGLKRVLVASNGRKQDAQEKIKVPWSNKRGHLRTELSKDGKSKRFYIHRLVAKAFIPNPNNLPQINHINNNPGCNLVENLEWVTQKENSNHAAKQGRIVKGAKHNSAKLTEEDVKWIRKNYILYDKNFSLDAIAKKYGMSHEVIRCIIKRRTWKHIP